METYFRSEQEILSVLKSIIHQNTTLDCEQFKETYLKRRIKARMRKNHVRTLNDYFKLLNSEPAEYDKLIEDITINVTHFFRDPEVFRVLEDTILPMLIASKVTNNRRVIRLWSAGCASGEEPYSLAIIMRELLGEDFDKFLVSIHGTDIDLTSLKKAIKGDYLPRQVENMKPAYVKRYMDFNGEVYRVKDEIRDIVRFRNIDLFSTYNYHHFDMILCRNVLIYFTKSMQDKLFHYFHSAINDNGYLILGKTETIRNNFDGKYKIINPKERVYQKMKI